MLEQNFEYLTAFTMLAGFFILTMIFLWFAVSEREEESVKKCWLEVGVLVSELAQLYCASTTGVRYGWRLVFEDHAKMDM